MRKSAFALCVIFMTAMLLGCFSACNAAEDKCVLNVVYTVGDGDYDFSAEVERNTEICKPLSEEIADDYYIIWTVDGVAIEFPFTITGDCTLVGNAYEYSDAGEVTFLGNADYKKLVDHIENEWQKRTLGNIDTDDEDMTYYYLYYGVADEHHEAYFYPSTGKFSLRKTEITNISDGRSIIYHYERKSYIDAIVGEDMSQAVFQTTYTAEKIDSYSLTSLGGFGAVFDYNIGKITTGFLLQNFEGVSWRCSVTSPTEQFDKSTFARDLYVLLNDSMMFMQNQLKKIDAAYWVFYPTQLAD